MKHQRPMVKKAGFSFFDTIHLQFFTFEQDLFTTLVTPWFDKTHTSDTCIAGENCPFRIAIIESITGKRKVWTGLKSLISRIRISFMGNVTASSN